MYVLSISTDSREQRKTLLFAAIINVIAHHMWQLWAYRFAVAVPAGVLLRFQASCCGHNGCLVAVPGVPWRSQWVSCCGSRRLVAVTVGVLLRLRASRCGHNGRVLHPVWQFGARLVNLLPCSPASSPVDGLRPAPLPYQGNSGQADHEVADPKKLAFGKHTILGILENKPF